MGEDGFENRQQRHERPDNPENIPGIFSSQIENQTKDIEETLGSIYCFKKIMEDFSIETKWKDDPGITHYEEINSDNGIFSVIYCERHSGGMGNLKAVTHTQKAQKKYEKTLERRGLYMTNLYEIIEERDRYKIYPSIVIDDIHKFTLFLQTRTEENVDDILLEKLDFILQATDRRIQKLPKDSEFINRALDILRLEPVIRHLKRLSGNEIKNISTAMKFQFLKEYFRAQSFGFKANIEEREEKNRDNIPYFIEDFLEGKKGREEIHKHIQIGIEYMKEPRVKNIYKTLLRELYMGIRCIQSESTDKKALGEIQIYEKKLKKYLQDENILMKE